MSTLTGLHKNYSKIIPIIVCMILFICLAGPSAYAQTTKNASDTLTKTPADTLKADTLDVPVSESALESEVKYNAKDSIIFDIAAKKVYLYGKAHMEYQDIVLDAAFISIDWNTNEISAEGLKDSTGKIQGNPVFKQADQETRQKKITYNFKTKKGRINELITKEGDEGFIHSKTVKTVKEDGKDVIYAKNAKYTTCNLDSPHFWIQTNKLKLIPKDKVITGPAYIVVQEVPIPLILPFGFFPANSRKTSGIIVPEVGNAGVRGFMLRNGGFYFGGSDYFDLALTGDIYTRGDYRVATESRYAKRYRFNGGLKLQYARLSTGIEETENYAVTENFQVNWAHAVNPKARPCTTFSANVNAGTGRFLQRTTFNANAILQQTLNSSISYGRQFRGTPFNLNTSLNHNQVVNTGEMDFNLPNVNFSMSRIFPFKPKAPLRKHWSHDIGIQYNLDFRNHLKTNEKTIRNDFKWENFNNGFMHAVPLSTAFKVFRFFTLSPSFGYNGYFYTKRIIKEWDDANDTLIIKTEKGFYQAHVWNANLNLSTMLYGMMNINRGRLMALRHVATPSVGFNYRPNYSAPGYGYYKQTQIDENGTIQPYSVFEGSIIGVPSGGKYGTMNFSLQNNFELKVKTKNDTAQATKKIKLLDNLSIGGDYNFLADSMRLSPINVTAFTTLFEKINVQGGFTIDPYQLAQDTDGRYFEVDRYMWDAGNNEIGRFTNATLNVSTNLNAEAREAQARTQKYSNPVIGYYYNEPYASFDVPWGFGFSYNLTYSKPLTEATVMQTVGVNGNLKLTKNWAISGQTNYDFRNKEFNLTEINIARDLHCWEMSFKWIPFGQYRSYFFNIHIKAATLRDLKLDKRKEYYEFQ